MLENQINIYTHIATPDTRCQYAEYTALSIECNNGDNTGMLVESYASKRDVNLGPLLLTWFNFNPSMDK